jgi:ABC-type Co2+ transport system permease subunit
VEVIKISEVTLDPKDNANLMLLKVNAYAILTISFGVITYFLIRAFDVFLQGPKFPQWGVYTVIGISCVVYALIVGFFAYWIKAYLDAGIIWFYGQFLYKKRPKEKKEEKK